MFGLLLVSRHLQTLLVYGRGIGPKFSSQMLTLVSILRLVEEAAHSRHRRPKMAYSMSVPPLPLLCF